MHRRYGQPRTLRDCRADCSNVSIAFGPASSRWRHTLDFGSSSILRMTKWRIAKAHDSNPRVAVMTRKCHELVVGDVTNTDGSSFDEEQ